MSFITDYIERWEPEYWRSEEQNLNAPMELEPLEFYREIFPEGELEAAGEYVEGKYTAIALEIEIDPDTQDKRVRRHTITDDLEKIEELTDRNNFVLISPVSYCGKSREAKNARFLYAIAIDLDGISDLRHLRNLFLRFESERNVFSLPVPTYIVSSGTGLHLYYKLEKPIPCYSSNKQKLSKLKQALTLKIWNSYVSVLYENPQIESLFQGFRMVGTRTKSGGTVRVWEYGKPVSIEYLNQFVDKESKAKDIVKISKYTREEAKEMFPKWYERRIEQKKPSGWTCNRGLYNWWLRKAEEIKIGHRYFYFMCLAIYAKKCDISREELEKDGFALLDLMKQQDIETNIFTNGDILSAFESYNDNYITFPIKSISQLTGISIEKNKRNYQKQEWHLEDIRDKKAKMIIRKQKFKNPEGRPSKRDIVVEWKFNNPDKDIKDCIRETGVSQSTAYKYWKEV